MSTVLRPYQIEVKNKLYDEWSNNNRNVCVVMPTGAGKSALMASVFSEHRGPSCVIAHRQELVSQLSMALARAGVRHRIVLKVKSPSESIHISVLLHSWLRTAIPSSRISCSASSNFIFSRKSLCTDSIIQSFNIVIAKLYDIFTIMSR